MQMGGFVTASMQAFDVKLVQASLGLTRFTATRWHKSCWDCWALDLGHEDQRQRIEGRAEFIRAGGTAALYRPGLCYEEWQEKGRSVFESWVLFKLDGALESDFLELAGAAGYCHFRDHDHVLDESLRRIGELVFKRRQGFVLLAKAEMFNLLGKLSNAPMVDSCFRDVCVGGHAPNAESMPAKVERYIRSRIGEPLHVANLARHVGMSLSSFAHLFNRLTGESPYRVIVRLKIENAKRLLLDENLTVKETADRLGYSTEFHFSRAFKRFEGIAPAQYVRTMNAKRNV